MRLENKIALISGAASGFGKAMAELFAKEGAKLVLVDIDGENLTKVKNKIGDRAIKFIANVGNLADSEAMIKEAIRQFGRLDILINNAGVTHNNMPLEKVSEEDFERVYQTNMKSIFYSSKFAVPIMKGQGGGIILSTASSAGLRPRPGLSWYNASKAWVINITKTMAVELAKDNIRVNCLCPVAGETPLLTQFMGEDSEIMREKFKSTIPMGRFSQPRDIANAALFLCSKEAEFITGVALEVDGGRCV